MKINLLKWCDEKITYLKKEGIKFKNGIPQLPKEYIYMDKPKALTTFATRKDIQDEYVKDAILVFYMYEERLWPRLYKIDQDIKIMKKFAGIGGFDLSPSINTLRPRQKMSILINAIHSSYCGSKGVKILPNYRSGDLGTISIANYFPNNVNFIIGNHGCNNKFKHYGEYIIDIIFMEKRIDTLYVYGSISKTAIMSLINNYGITIITFPDRRNRIRNGNKSYIWVMKDGKVTRQEYNDKTRREIA